MGGVAYVGDDEAFSIALDLQYALYSRNTVLAFDVTGDTTLNWKDTFKAMLGGEVKVADNWLVRLGAGVHTKVTNVADDSVLFTPPALGISAGAGFGYQAETWSLDLSYDLNTGSEQGQLTSTAGAKLAATDHKATAHAIGLSLNYAAL